MINGPKDGSPTAARAPPAPFSLHSGLTNQRALEMREQKARSFNGRLDLDTGSMWTARML
eukprot:scaffold644_cov126-Isochrysis_galbana.AAC.7